MKTQPYQRGTWWCVFSPYAPARDETYRPIEQIVPHIRDGDFYWAPATKAGDDIICFRRQADALMFIENGGAALMTLAK